MKYLLTAIAICALTAGMVNVPAGASDINDPMIEEQIAKEQARWSGPYVGIAGTLGMTNTDLDADIPAWGIDDDNTLFRYENATLDGLGSEGVGLTGIVGYDKRFGRFVAGVFGDFTYSDDLWESDFALNDTDVGEDDDTIAVGVNREYDWTAGVRLGALINPATMVYGLAGYSQMKMSADGGSTTFKGYTLGAGLESKFNDYVTGYVEGRWSQYGDETVFHDAGDPEDPEDDLTISAEPSEVKAMAGIKFRLLTE